MEMRHLNGFLALAEELHFGRAAERLHMSQPAMSRIIRQLELDLGVRLFSRSTRDVALTPAGRTFLQGSRRALVTLEEAARAAREAERAGSDTLRIGYSECTEELLPSVLRTLGEHSPSVRPEVCSVERPVQPRRLCEGDLDVAIRRAPVAEPELETELLFREPMVVVLTRHHPLASFAELAMGQLASYPFVVLPDSTGHACLLEASNDAGFSPLTAEAVSSVSSLLVMVAAGAGLALVPLSIARRFVSQDVVHRHLDPPPSSPVMVAWRREDRRQPLLSFLAAVRNLSRYEPVLYSASRETPAGF